MPAAARFRGGDPAAGIETLHGFSFGPHYDPDNLRFGPLIAVNEERLAPGAGFEEHAHRDVEIVTFVVDGELAHDDTAGHRHVVRAGEIQWLSAGDGVRHTERNARPDRPLTFLQMWLEPGESGGPPAYGRTSGDRVSTPRRPGCALVVHRGPARLPAAPLRHLHVVRGRLLLDGQPFGPGDAARVTGGGDLTVDTVEADPETTTYLVWSLDA
ncbi:pirin family protein [Streptantibioticus parmotrematis]|uniref:pirin family protein n=1 Tax=Streptantibioticus parmotrematis TaxID=2873249 RepID=UPI0033E9001C